MRHLSLVKILTMKNFLSLSILFLSISFLLNGQTECNDPSLTYENENNLVSLANAFSPNNDGVNDLYFILFQNLEVGSSNIYDVNGNLINNIPFEGNLWTWDGLNSSGNLTAGGQYVIQLQAIFSNGDTVDLCQNITVLYNNETGENCLNADSTNLIFPSQFDSELMYNASFPSNESFCESWTVGLNESSNFDLNIFPNPSSDFINVNFKNNNQNLAISLFDLNGKMLFQQNSFNRTSEKIDVSNLEKGIYYLQIQSETEQISRRVIVL